MAGWLDNLLLGLVDCVVSICEVFQIFLAERYADTTSPVLALAGSYWAWFMYQGVVYDLRNCSLVAERLGRPAEGLVEGYGAMRAGRSVVAGVG